MIFFCSAEYTGSPTMKPSVPGSKVPLSLIHIGVYKRQADE
ncbi:hypothetical protein [Streptomyces resistomycificus]